MLAGLPYVVWPVGSLFILASRKKDDPFLHYHAVQGGIFGAVMGVVAVASFIGLGIVFRLLPGTSVYLPGMLGMATLAGGGLVLMAIFLTAIFLAWRATEGEMLRLPFIGDFAEDKMLDHTGMTRRQFEQMLEQSFIEPTPDEPEAIPFPEYGTPALTGKAAEVMATRTADGTTPASLKAAEILAHRQAKQAAAEKAAAAAQATLAIQQKSANLAAQQAAALQAAQQGTQRPQAQAPAQPPAQPAPRPAQPPQSAPRPAPSQQQGQQQQRPAAANNGAGQAPRPNVPSAPAATPAERAKSYPLIRESSENAAPQVKEVDLIRHYKERRPAAPQSDALRNWLTAVDEG